MSLTYHLVQRPDKSEGALEGSKLYYGQIKIRQQVDFDTLCERIADRSTASKGDVMVVIDGLIRVLTTELQAGNSVQIGCSNSRRVQYVVVQERKDYLHAWQPVENHECQP